MKTVAFILIFSALTRAETVTNGTEDVNRTAITGASGKTYFLQLKKVGDGIDEGPKYQKINHYVSETKKSMRNSFVEESLIQEVSEDLQKLPEEESEFIDDIPSFMDEEWTHSPQHNMYDLPNITYEIYEAMAENNRNNAIVNSTIVKFFFETDTNLSSNIIRFNIESLGNLSGKILDAELHVYRLPRDVNSTKTSSKDNVVRLYQMTEDVSEEINSTVASINADIHKLANVIYISSNYAGWQVFKVGNVVENWRNGDDNLGFLITTTNTLEHEEFVNFAHRESNGGKYQPTLVVHFERQDPVNKKKTEKLSSKYPLMKPTKLMEVTKYFTPCTRAVWYVSFHELGWNNFIISPPGYMAYKCAGTCKALSADYSNHGKLQNIFERNSNGVTPSCVPNRYKTLTVMYYDRDSNVIIKEYPDMVVHGCGCR